MKLGFFKFLIVTVLLLGIAGVVFIAITDVPVVQQEVTVDIQPAE